MSLYQRGLGLVVEEGKGNESVQLPSLPLLSVLPCNIEIGEKGFLFFPKEGVNKSLLFPLNFFIFIAKVCSILVLTYKLELIGSYLYSLRKLI